MVTPRKPGAKRGRPLGAKSTKPRPDPLRYAVPFVDVLMALDATSSLQQCLLLAAAFMLGEPKPAPPDMLDRHPRLTGLQWEKAYAPNAITTTIDGRVATLRQKYARTYNLEIARDRMALHWRHTIARALLIAITAKDRKWAKDRVLELAMAVGEDGFARDVLWRMIDAELQPSQTTAQPEVCPN